MTTSSHAARVRFDSEELSQPTSIMQKSEGKML
jgi:hypothetical protein